MAERSVSWLRIVLSGLLLMAAGSTLAASQVDLHEFDTAEQRERYKSLIAELRCPKCLNTNLAGSDAPIAEDLRRAVHRLITEENMTDDEIRDFLQARYGDFVLYDPPFRPDTWVLWLAPALFLAIGAVVLWRMLRQPEQPLSADEAARLRTILDQD
ncbi:MAG: cytochrome c-type biogenesis protein [Gammaproteobacteria bacterium]|nr:cytochrome c-type biogenesis protein [Gammaproteobacteria bacterium]